MYRCDTCELPPLPLNGPPGVIGTTGTGGGFIYPYPPGGRREGGGGGGGGDGV